MSPHPSYRRPSGVGMVTEETSGEARPRVFLAHLPDGPIVVLEGSSAVIWHAATTNGPETLVERVAAATGVEPDEIAAHVDRFVQELVDRGLLEPVPEPTN